MKLTPSSRWSANGESDPHGNYYDCERANLTCGHMTDDEIANAVFMNPSIANTTAAKDRIRWLSRALNATMRQIIRHANETAPYADDVAAEATLRARVERENAELRRAIMGAEPMPEVSHGQFLEMARSLHSAITETRAAAIERTLDAAGDYMGEQYGNTALHHPTDRERIKRRIQTIDEAHGYCTDCENETIIHNSRCGCGSGRVIVGGRKESAHG